MYIYAYLLIWSEHLKEVYCTIGEKKFQRTAFLFKLWHTSWNLTPAPVSWKFLRGSCEGWERMKGVGAEDEAAPLKKVYPTSARIV